MKIFVFFFFWEFVISTLTFIEINCELLTLPIKFSLKTKIKIKSLIYLLINNKLKKFLSKKQATSTRIFTEGK